ncbi:hypothetical protein LA080_009293 [Diaporthe eres]|nr:hypothetical protein LA080_009293 [Diaporthe eres]
MMFTNRSESAPSAWRSTSKMMRASRNSLGFDSFLLTEQEKKIAGDQALAQVEAEERELPANQNKRGEGMVDEQMPTQQERPMSIEISGPQQSIPEHQHQSGSAAPESTTPTICGSSPGAFDNGSTPQVPPSGPEEPDIDAMKDIQYWIPALSACSQQHSAVSSFLQFARVTQISEAANHHIQQSCLPSNHTSVMAQRASPAKSPSLRLPQRRSLRMSLVERPYARKADEMITLISNTYPRYEMGIKAIPGHVDLPNRQRKKRTPEARTEKRQQTSKIRVALGSSGQDWNNCGHKIGGYQHQISSMPYEVIYPLEGALKIRRHPGRALTSKLHPERSLQVHHQTTEPDLKGFLEGEKELGNTLHKLQRTSTDHIKLMEDAWARRHISVAMGYQLTIKNLRIELAVRFRDLNQKAMNVLDKLTRSSMGEGSGEPFKPMNVKLDPEAANRPLTEGEKVTRDIKVISHNYQGYSNNLASESADIPEHENCSVWITNLPPDCTYRDLLAAANRPLTEEEKITRDIKGISHR